MTVAGRNAMAWWFDRPLLNAFTRKWEKNAVETYHERVRQHEESIPAPIAAAMQNIDAKATGLLTHVSMMIAGLGLIGRAAPRLRARRARIAAVRTKLRGRQGGGGGGAQRVRDPADRVRVSRRPTRRPAG